MHKAIATWWYHRLVNTSTVNFLGLHTLVRVPWGCSIDSTSFSWIEPPPPPAPRLAASPSWGCVLVWPLYLQPGTFLTLSTQCLTPYEVRSNIECKYLETSKQFYDYWINNETIVTMLGMLLIFKILSLVLHDFFYFIIALTYDRSAFCF